MDLLFFNCSSLISLPDISKWNILLSNLEDNKSKLKFFSTEQNHISSTKESASFISESYDDLYIGNIILESYKFETIEQSKEYLNENAYSLHGLFAGCSSLKFLPDISKWNIEKTKDLSLLFCGCTSLIELPDISHWNTTNVNNM